VRIAVLSHYFWPEPGAPSARLLEMSREWAARGHEVVNPFHPHPLARALGRFRDWHGLYGPTHDLSDSHDESPLG